MICSLLVFLGMFKTHTQAIDHYNNQRAQNKKALTINSQKRYVKFFCGFLHYKLRDSMKQEESQQTFFELSLRKHNYLSFNRVFEDMRNEVVDFHSICLGPFNQQFANFDIIVSYMKKDEIEHIFSYENHIKRLQENQLEENGEINKIKKWERVEGPNGTTQWFLILNLYEIEQKVWGDFKIQFKSPACVFYFWLNVSAILYNSELAKITESQGLHDDPIHFKEFKEIEDTGQKPLEMLLPKKHVNAIQKT